MSVALSILLAPLLAAGVVSARAALRDRDLRHAGLFVLIGLLAARHALDPPLPDAFQQAFELASAPVMLDLAVNLAVWWLAITVGRSLHERNRAEQVQWRDMETLRELASALRGITFGTPASADRVLALGCRRFEFETGLLVRLTGIESSEPTVEIVAVHGAAATGELVPGPCPALARTLAARCAITDDVVTVEHASAGHWSTHPEHAPFGWESFLGVRVDGGPDDARVLCFADRTARAERVAGSERIQISLMASWFAHSPRSHERTPFDSDKTLVPAHPAETGKATTVDLDRALRSLEPRLLRALAPGRRLELALDAANSLIDLTEPEFDRVVYSMLLHVADFGPNDGALAIRTGLIGSGEPEAPGFATIGVHAHGPVLNSDALSLLYQQSESVEVSGLRRLPLTSVVRMLHGLGGDLSMESEEGVGTTLTAFLPSRRDA